MSINRKDYLTIISGLPREVQQALSAHDTAQREALARVEAEHATWMEQYNSVVRYGNELLVERDAAQALLRELDAYLSGHDDNAICNGSRLHREIQGLLAAPAEQQEAQGSQAGEFQREDRYIVIKRKDLEAIERSGEASDLETHEAVRFLAESLDTLRPHLPAREYLVIESNWPEYELAWAAIQARVEANAALGGDKQ